MKKKIVFIYHSMIIGGSTTALLSLMSNMDPQKYDIDLQLFRNRGPLLDIIPSYVNLLPEAERYIGMKGRLVKLCKFFFKGYFLRFLWKKFRGKNEKSVLSLFQSKELSKKNVKNYDYAVGFLEGWSDWYLAFGILATKKYAWLHSTYANITKEPTSELPWMQRVDKIVFVADSCREAFEQSLPQMVKKSITIENITDSRIIKQRSLQIDDNDLDYQRFVSTDGLKIITVCRLTVHVKGLDRIVNCSKLLKESGCRFYWYIVGDGEDKDYLQALIETAGVYDCVVLVGKRMNPYPFIAAADLMCMPSRYEGKPITITESMILGTPPIVTEYLSAHDQINHGKEGIIVPNEDNAIVDAISRLIQDTSLCGNMKKRLLSSEYGNTEYISKIEKILFD